MAWLVIGAIVGAGIVLTRDHFAPIQENSGPPAGTSPATYVAQKLGPSVGTIIATIPGGPFTSSSFSEGSGFVFVSNANGSDLITNNHVVAGAASLAVAMPNGRTVSASLVGTDSLDDIAVISIPVGNLPVATFGDSDKLLVGETVVAIGSPLGNAGSVTQGVISALHRTIQAGDQSSAQTETLQDVLQTDAPISPGNSGGPLADSSGEVIGVNVATSSGGGASNIGFSIPANLAHQVADELLGGKPVEHPYIGIAYLTSIEAVEAGSPFDGPGVLITGVQPGSPAAQAGFLRGDILIAINGVTIDNGVTIGGLVQRLHVGATIHCAVKRGSQTLTFDVTLIERPG